LKTTIDLFPSNHSYRIEGSYILENKTKIAIDSLLINFADGFEIKKAFLLYKNEKISIKKQYKTIYLQESLLPGEKMNFEFEMFYHWIPVNGHQSFNAIVDNGSFMRISRFYPAIGYISSKELEDIELRNQYKLGEKTKLKPLEAPKDTLDDFIALDMTVSTEQDQTVVGIGELTKEWKAKNRNYYQFQVEAIPFRFGVSSAKYAVKRETYHGIKYEIYYHPDHSQNVDHLLKNAKITMDYCQNNFGPYPFKTIRFAEISSFTSGFAATAYPTSIYMIENMIFHSNIAADQQQDVINELAGHELAHLWWGNSQIDPDYREGDVMLTETLAMYTEVMLLKKMYGKQIAEKHLAIHKGIFENVKGFNGDKPLIKATSEDTHISYSKGALAMYHLSEMIGEDKVNEALKNFLIKHKYPNPKPISTDLVDEILGVVDPSDHHKIRKLFMQ
jgi:ABC-2 type transport system permease protein